jgi:hypothetical protein
MNNFLDRVEKNCIGDRFAIVGFFRFGEKLRWAWNRVTIL